MMFRRDWLEKIDVEGYYVARGVKLSARGRWRSAACPFCNSKSALRILHDSGGFCCMACAAKGGSILDFERALHGVDFETACRNLGVWAGPADGGRHVRPDRLGARDSISLVLVELNIVLVAAFNLAGGHQLSRRDLDRLMVCHNRIEHVLGVFA
jgi:hypothetical protein